MKIGAVLFLGDESGPDFIPPLCHNISTPHKKKHSLYLLVPETFILTSPT